MKPLNINNTYFSLVNQGGSSPSQIQLNNIGISSDRQIILNEQNPNGAEFLSVDLGTKDFQRKANSAEAILPHPK